MELEESTCLTSDYTTKPQSSRQCGIGTKTEYNILDEWLLEVGKHVGATVKMATGGITVVMDETFLYLDCIDVSILPDTIFLRYYHG